MTENILNEESEYRIENFSSGFVKFDNLKTVFHLTLKLMRLKQKFCANETNSKLIKVCSLKKKK